MKHFLWVAIVGLGWALSMVFVANYSSYLGYEYRPDPSLAVGAVIGSWAAIYTMPRRNKEHAK
jgi:hypothetical protein